VSGRPPALSTRALGRATLARQGLLGRTDLSVAKACERFGGFQAQEARPPALGLWNRLEGFDVEQLRRAARRGTVVRAVLLRGTIHLVSARDFAWMRPTVGPVLTAGMRSPGIEDLDLPKVLAAARRLLAQEPRTFGALREALAESFPGDPPRALGSAVRLSLPLTMVPTDDPWCWPPDARFALAETGAEDPAALVRRHLAAFGPATGADVQAWSGVKGLKDVIAGLADELVELTDDRRRTLWDLPDAPRPDEETEAPPRFLPSWDSLVMAHRDRTRVVPEEHRAKLTSKNLRVLPTFLWDGVVAGLWGVETKRGTATLEVRPFARLPRGAKGALEAEAEAALAFAAPGAARRAIAFASA
jgi:Winged helix DNA-binding domain